MKLKYQLFLALLAGGVLLIALLAGIADWSFNRGFLDHVNRQERQRLDTLRAALLDGYEQHGSWRWIDERPGGWQALVRENMRLDRRRDRGLPPGGTVLLADSEQRILAGRKDESATVRWSPLTVDTELIAYLGSRPLKRVPPGLNRLFAQRQRRNFLLASLGLLPLSALLAWLLTTRIVRPLDQLNAAVARIGAGNFDERLPALRRDELGELQRQVNHLAATLESNLKARRRWLAEISHELRTPVAVLQAELEAMQDGINPVDESSLASLHLEARRLSRLIDDLRDLTLADAGALDYRFALIDLSALINNRLDQIHVRLDEARLTLDSKDEGPLLVEADAQRLSQLIDNLVQNSLRYTDAGGQLEVRLKRMGGHARLRWSDSAPGVPDKDLAHLFNPLFRVDDSRRRASGGSGLGLAIAGKIAEAHGGSIVAMASELGGLSIELRLPLATETLTGNAKT